MLFPMLMKAVVGISLFNFVLTTFIYLSRRRNLQVAFVNDRTSTVSNDAFRKFESAWFREEISRHTRNFHVDSDLMKRKGPNVPMLKFDKIPTRRQSSPSKWLNLFQQTTHRSGEEGDINAKAIRPSDVYFSVRTTQSNHVTRLPVLLDTWISVVPNYTTILTDSDDPVLEENLFSRFGDFAPRLLVTDCPSKSHSKWALFCKLYWEYKNYAKSHVKESWFCHFDDDSYVNVAQLLTLLGHFDPSEAVYLGRAPSKTRPTLTLAYNVNLHIEPYNEQFQHVIKDEADLVSFHFALGGAGFCISKELAERMKPVMEGPSIVRIAASITLPDDCVMGYVITHVLNVSLTNVMQMHSHIEDMTSYTLRDLADEVTFSFASPTVDDATIPKKRLSVENHQHKKRLNLLRIDSFFTKRLHNALYKTRES